MLDKMLLSFHGVGNGELEEGSSWRGSCAAVTPAGGRSAEGFPVTVEKPPSFTQTHTNTRAHTHTHYYRDMDPLFESATENSLSNTGTLTPACTIQKSRRGLTHDDSLMLNSPTDTQTSEDNLCNSIQR